MPKTAKLLKFLIENKIPIREAIDFLKLVERMIVAKKLAKEAVITKSVEVGHEMV
jgi:hypothetical protein